jgi:hypothetical protein
MFQCPACHTGNQPNARFCQQCGLQFGAPSQQYQPKQPGIGTGVKIGIGIFIGFLLMMGACAACFVGTMNRTLNDSTALETRNREAAAARTLMLEDVTGKKEHGFFTVTGRVKNTGNEPASFVKVNIEYLDKNDKVLDSDSTYAVGADTIAPGNSKVFTIMSGEVRGVIKYRCFIYKDWNVSGNF